MIKKILKLIFVFILLSNATFHSIANNKLPDNMNTMLLTNKELSKLEIELLNKFLIHQGYKLPSAKTFHLRCLDYFNIDTNEISEDEYKFVGNDNNYINKKGRFLFNFTESIFYRPDLLDAPYTIADARKDLETDYSGETRYFIAYNKLLFNDVADNEFFLKNPALLVEVVLNFNYESNNFLYENAIPLIETNDKTVLPYVLFYNNYHKGYRARLLNDLYVYQGISAIKEILTLLDDNWHKMDSGINLLQTKVIIPQALRDNALLHLLKLVSQHHDQQTTQQHSRSLAYQYLQQFISKDPQLALRLQKNNYYQMGLTLQSEQKQLLSTDNNDLLNNIFITQSSDNYINLRQSPTTKSPVIRQLANQYKVIKLHTDGNWYYVKSIEDESLSGYIHMSQLVYFVQK
jgi:hypothetical protein